MSDHMIVARRIEKRVGYYTPEHSSAAWRLEFSVDWLAMRKPGEAKMWTDALKRIGRPGAFVRGGSVGNSLLQLESGR
jgi:hypothetical protein